MEKANPIREKSFNFALRIIRFCEMLNEWKQYVLSKQLLKSGTSIGANVREALQGQSRADFISKLSIALKEASETDYWLSLIEHSSIAKSGELTVLQKEVKEILALLTAIIKTSKKSA